MKINPLKTVLFVAVTVATAFLISLFTFNNPTDTVAAQAVPAAAGSSYTLFLPTILKPAPQLLNANFEDGRTGWIEASTDSHIIIRTDQPVMAHSGSWVAWLGGVKNNISSITQQVLVPSSAPYLAYYHYIASSDVCGYDEVVLFANLTQVNTYALCSSQSTNGWVKRVVNLSAFAGQTISLQIRVETDSTLNSNLFIDDVSFQSSASAAVETFLLDDGSPNSLVFQSGSGDSPELIEQLRFGK